MSVPTSEIDALLDDRPVDGVFRVNPAIFRRSDIFDLEMRHVFESTWLFVGLECQVPQAHQFFRTQLGRQSVFVSRDGEGRLHCLINACRHRGAMVCQEIAGTRAAHSCPYHGWTYDSAGRIVTIPGLERGGYTAAFQSEDHDLRPVPRFECYRGFMFASLSPNVPPLADYLGDLRIFIDLAADQGEQGLEIVPGGVRYSCFSNWKFVIENSADSYHFFPTHQSYLQILRKRAERDTGSVGSGRSGGQPQSGTWTFPHGHSVFWAEQPIEESPLFETIDELRARVGVLRAKWMTYTRNALIFPNLILLEAPVLQVRVIQPVSPNETRITTFCVAPKGESRSARNKRLRLYEEFFNPGGMATPDDMVNLESCQRGPQVDLCDWHQGYMRGLGALHGGLDPFAEELGLHPEGAPSPHPGLGDETVFHAPLREWRRLLIAGLTRQAASL